MKRRVGILLAILILSVPAGCKKAASQNPGGAAGSFQTASSQAAVSSAGGAVSAGIGLQKGEAVQLAGENSDFELKDIDFLNDNTGWMIQSRYDAGSDSYHSQLLSTADGGESWQKVGTDGLALDTVFFIGPKEGWAVSQEAVSSAKSANGSPAPFRYRILHTEDGGRSWAVQWRSSSDEPGDSGTKPELWAADARSAVALAGGSLLKTADGGKTWAAVSFGAKGFVPECFAFSDAKTGWVAGVSDEKGSVSVFQTPDGGKSWKHQFRKKQDAGSAGAIGIDFLNGREGWLLTSDMSTMEGELFSTANGGVNWQPVGEIRIARPYAEGLCFSDARTGWIPFDAGPGPIDGGLSVTRDGGKSFRLVGETGGSNVETRKITNAREIVFRTAKSGWAVGNAPNYGDYLLRTQDGGQTWEQLYPKPGPVSDISFTDAQNGFGLGELADENALLATRDGGQTWAAVFSFAGTCQAERISFISPTEGWTLAYGVDSDGVENSQTVLHTSDGGKTWSSTGSFPAYATARYFRFFDAENGVAVQEGAEYRLSRTSDGGKTWSPSSGSFGNGALADQAELGRLSGDKTKWQYPSSALANTGGIAAVLLPAGKGMVLAETPPGGSAGRFELLTASDGGSTWDQHLFPEELSEDTFEDPLNECKMQFADGAHGWILTSHGMLSTQDGGRTWVWR